jgi:hypothetical protein
MPLPRVEPIIPVSIQAPFDDPGWLFEFKYDGYRGLYDVEHGRARFISRNALSRFTALGDQVAAELRRRGCKDERQKPRPQEHDKSIASAADQPIYERFADWVLHNFWAGIAGGGLLTLIIGSGAYLLYDGQSALHEIDPTLQDVDARSAEFIRGRDMTQVYGQGWNSQKANLDHLSALVHTLVTKINDPQLDSNFARDELKWCTQTISELVAEQGKIDSFLVADDFDKQHKSALLADYDATIKLVTAIQDMILGWSSDNGDQRRSGLKEIQEHALASLKQSAAIKSLGQQFDAYWHQKLEEDRVKKEAGLRKIREVRIKSDFALATILVTLSVLILSVAIVANRALSIRTRRKAPSSSERAKGGRGGGR